MTLCRCPVEPPNRCPLPFCGGYPVVPGQLDEAVGGQVRVVMLGF
jgi:hypothetical protein